MSALAADRFSAGVISPEANLQTELSLVPSFEDVLAAAGTPTASGEGWAWFQESKTLFVTEDTGDFGNEQERPWDAYEKQAETLYCAGAAGRYAFQNFSVLKTAVLDGSVAGDAFSSASALTDVTISGAEIIETDAFVYCNALKKCCR